MVRMSSVIYYATDSFSSFHRINSVEDLYKCPVCLLIKHRSCDLADHIVYEIVISY